MKGRVVEISVRPPSKQELKKMKKMKSMAQKLMEKMPKGKKC